MSTGVPWWEGKARSSQNGLIIIRPALVLDRGRPSCNKLRCLNFGQGP